MLAFRPVALVLICSALLAAQGDDIFARLQRVLFASGQGGAAVSELRAKNYARVEERLARAKTANPAEQAELWALRGAVAFLAGNMAQASTAFTESAKLRPARETDRFTLAMAFVNLGNDARARDMLTSLANEHAGSPVYWYWLGRLDYDQRRYAEAVDKLKIAADRDPRSARIWDSLGLAWDMQGRSDQAKEAFEKAAGLNREQARPSPWPPHNFGSLLLRTGDANAAETLLKESLRYDPNLGRTHFYLARAFEKEGRDPEAIEEYQKAVTLDTHSADACYALGVLYRKLHREADATEMFAEFKRRK